MKAPPILSGLVLLLVFSCNYYGWKKVDLNAFEISVPDTWQPKSAKSFDSFAGDFVARKLDLTFDYSKQGFAANLLPTEKEYLAALWVNLWYSPEQDGQSFHIAEAEDMWNSAPKAKEVAQAMYRSDSLKSGLAKKSVVIFKATRPLKKDKPLPDYFAIVKYQHHTDTVTIHIPIEIKQQNFSIDKNDKYVTKTIWPKVPGKGMTGIFIYRTDSNFTFNLHGENLSAQNEQLALKAFKTIKFK